MRVTVTPLSCDANAMCIDAAPDVFELGDDDVVRIVLPEPPPERADAVREAVYRCPKQALRIVG
jgi:ferredoxin